MRIHLTGGTGFLGRELAAHAPGATTERVEIRDGAAVRSALERLRPDVVVHTAYRQDGDGAWETVVEGSANVAVAVAAVGARLVHLSTDVVFDGRLGRPYVETDPPCPCTDYGRAKAEAEDRVRAACPGALVVRTSLILGGPGHEPSRHELAASDPGATFYADELRSPVQVTDLARALLHLAVRPVSGVLHVAGDDHLSRAELATLVRGGVVRSAAAPPTRPLDCRLDSSRARALLAAAAPTLALRGARTVFA